MTLDYRGKLICGRRSPKKRYKDLHSIQHAVIRTKSCRFQIFTFKEIILVEILLKTVLISWTRYENTRKNARKMKNISSPEFAPRHICPVCSRVFLSRLGLVKHMKRHSGNEQTRWPEFNQQLKLKGSVCVIDHMLAWKLISPRDNTEPICSICSVQEAIW